MLAWFQVLRRAAVSAGLLALAACGAPAPAPPPATPEALASAEDGLALAELRCAQCHAIGREGESPNPQSPPFRGILARYDGEALAADLAEGIRIGHPGMPEIQLEPRGVDALIAYLRTLEEPAPQ